MILVTHILVAAVIVSKIHFAPLVLFLAFLSHYFLDFIPHQEYDIKSIAEKRWKESFFDFCKVFLDVAAGLLPVILLSKANLLFFAAAFLAILPDLFTFPYLIFPSNRLLKMHFNLQKDVIHFMGNKKIPFFWRIFNQLAVIFLALFLLTS